MPKNTTGSDGTVKTGGILAGCTSAVMNTECKRGELISITEDSEADNIIQSNPSHASVQKEKLSFGFPCFYLMNRSGKGYLTSRSQTGRGREQSRLTRRETKTDKLLDYTVSNRAFDWEYGFARLHSQQHWGGGVGEERETASLGSYLPNELFPS